MLSGGAVGSLPAQLGIDFVALFRKSVESRTCWHYVNVNVWKIRNLSQFWVA